MQGLYAPQNAKLKRVRTASGARVKAGEVIVELDDSAQRIHFEDMLRQRDRAQTQFEWLSQQSKRNEPTEIDTGLHKAQRNPYSFKLSKPKPL